MSRSRHIRLLKRNELIRERFSKMAAKKCYRIDYMLEVLSIETGLHPDYIRTIVRDYNITELRIRKMGVQSEIFPENEQE